MKKIFSFILLLTLASPGIYAQAPNGMNYQAIARNAAGVALPNTHIGIRFTITNGSAGAKLYSEHDTVTTNALGLFTLTVGGGVADTGTFSSIPWETVTPWLQVWMDVSGGTNYVLMGSSQLMSVPYALYAKSAGTTTTNIGKTYIILSGDITDVEVAVKIQQDFGPSTQYIWILNTSQLTTATFSGITSQVGLRIESNEALQSVSFPNLTTLYQDISIQNNPLLTSLSMPLLNACYGKMEVFDNGMTALTLPALTKLSSYLHTSGEILTSISLPVLSKTAGFSIEGNSVASFSVPALVTADNISVNQTAITSLSFPSLTTAKLGIGLNTNPLLTSLSLPVLTSTGSLVMQATALTSLDVTSLITCTGYMALINTSLTSVSFPALTGLGDGLTITGLSVTSVSFPVLASACTSNPAGSIYISGTSITSFDLPALTVFNGGDLTLSSNQLTSASVNSVLSKCVMLNLSNKQIETWGQNPPAPPTGQGVIDKQTLTDNGNTVSTD